MVGIVNLLVKMVLLSGEQIVAQIEDQHILLGFDLVGVITVKHAVAHGLIPILWRGKEEEPREFHAKLLVLIEDRCRCLALI